MSIGPDEWFKRLLKGSGLSMEDIFSEFYCDTDIRISYEEATFTVEEQLNYEETISFFLETPRVVPKYRRHSHSDTIRPRVRTRSRSIDGSPYGASAVPVDIIRSDISPVDKQLLDIIKTDKDIKLIVQIPFVKKNEIKLTAIGKRIEIFAKTKSGPYHKYVHIPSGANVRSAKSRYNNGILEITFSKKGHQNAKYSKNTNRIRH